MKRPDTNCCVSDSGLCLSNVAVSTKLMKRPDTNCCVSDSGLCLSNVAMSCAIKSNRKETKIAYDCVMLKLMSKIFGWLCH